MRVCATTKFTSPHSIHYNVIILRLEIECYALEIVDNELKSRGKSKESENDKLAENKLSFHTRKSDDRK